MDPTLIKLAGDIVAGLVQLVVLAQQGRPKVKEIAENLQKSFDILMGPKPITEEELAVTKAQLDEVRAMFLQEGQAALDEPDEEEED